MPELDPSTNRSSSQPVNIIGVRIAGLSRLAGDDRLRAAALALKREFGIATESIALAVIDLGYEDRALIAYAPYAPSSASASPQTVDAWFEPFAQKREVVWSMNVGNSESVIYSEHGATAISTWQVGDSPPDALVALANERARLSQPLTVWLDSANSNSAQLPDSATLAHWSAALGAVFKPLEARPRANPLTLRRVPSLASTPAASGLDRALWVAAVASVCCLAVASARTLLSAPPAVASARAVPAGELWARTTLASPVLAQQVKAATFGGGAWVLAVPGIAAPELDRAATTLRDNGFATQLVREPEARIRVQP